MPATGSTTVTSVATNTGSTESQQGPRIEKTEAIDSQHVLVVFNEGVLLPEKDPETAFTINPYNEVNSYLEIKKVEFDSRDQELKSIIITTAQQKNEENYIITAGVNITSLAKEPVISGVFDTGFFIGSSLEGVYGNTNIPVVTSAGTGSDASSIIIDLSPPENITDLMLTEKLLQLNEYLVTLTWTPSANTAGDLIDQILYKSLNRGETYDNGTSLGITTSRYETKLEGGKEYTFKITTKDNSGNESTGMIKSIRLPQTGPGLAILMALSGLGASQILRRKQK